VEPERVVAYGTEGVSMLEPKIVRQIRELATRGCGSRRIAGELGVARNTKEMWGTGRTSQVDGRGWTRPTVSDPRRLRAYLARPVFRLRVRADFGEVAGFEALYCSSWSCWSSRCR
jgi:hypothetical protein